MEHLPSVFNELWNFLVTPLLELVILLFLFYLVADKTALASKINNFSKGAVAQYRLLRMRIMSPLGINAITAVTGGIILLSLLVALNRITHKIGEVVPGNLVTYEQDALVRFSTTDQLSKIWRHNPQIKDIDGLFQYMTGILYKDTQNYPELLKMFNYRNEQIGSIMLFRQFEKFLIIYVLVIIPLLGKWLKIPLARPGLKLALLTFIILGFLTVNFYSQYENIKRIHQTNTFIVGVILESQVTKPPSEDLHVYDKMINAYRQKFATDFPVFLAW